MARVVVVDFVVPSGEDDPAVTGLLDPAVLLQHIRCQTLQVPSGPATAMPPIREIAVFAMDPSDTEAAIIGPLHVAIHGALGPRANLTVVSPDDFVRVYFSPGFHIPTYEIWSWRVNREQLGLVP